MAGYSTKTLAHKLGIQSGFRILTVAAPTTCLSLLGPLPFDVTILKDPQGTFHMIHLFVREKQILEQACPLLQKKIIPDGMLWISWPKGSSGVLTDLTENVIREIGLANGMVDVKVCAIDDIWSGLKFVYRITDRKHRSK